VTPNLGSSNHQPLPPEGGQMTKNWIVTESDVHCKHAKHMNWKALQMPKPATKQDEIENSRRTLYALF
jgi:hypothetical protein